MGRREGTWVDSGTPQWPVILCEEQARLKQADGQEQFSLLPLGFKRLSPSGAYDKDKIKKLIHLGLSLSVGKEAPRSLPTPTSSFQFLPIHVNSFQFSNNLLYRSLQLCSTSFSSFQLHPGPSYSFPLLAPAFQLKRRGIDRNIYGNVNLLSPLLCIMLLYVDYPIVICWASNAIILSKLQKIVSEIIIFLRLGDRLVGDFLEAELLSGIGARKGCFWRKA
ncbi:hypothetical protein Cgig2_026856 [Carnegiea gigantea]|uniref:Uncharacterized protein n=1 Tax=Carnegiea gigantea TaxID=171969 RepID=A0A9Q1QQR2_9CARY|nr:hypothetical protein Cgig2_026856 [Carnegiea gigantea]